MKIKIKSMRGAEMAATLSVWDKRNWLYINFDKRSRTCVDLNTGQVVKSQSHCEPVYAPGELERVIEIGRAMARTP